MNTNPQKTEQLDSVRKLVERWVDAERRGDAEDLAPLLAEDVVLVGPLGFLLDKHQFLASRRSGDLKHESFDWEESSVRLYGGTAVAIGSQTQTTAYQGRDASGRFRVTLVAAEQGSRWVLAGVHLSPIAQPPGTPSR